MAPLLYSYLQKRTTCSCWYLKDRCTPHSRHLMVVFSKTDDRNADTAILERLASKLELRTVADLKVETAAVRKLVKERAGLSVEASQQIIELLGKFKKTG